MVVIGGFLLKAKLIFLALALLWPAHLQAVGHQRAQVPAEPPIELRIWYPSSAEPSRGSEIMLGQAVAIDGPVEGDSLPLIVISHGHDSSMDAHAHTGLALAEAGYVAVALTHPGDNHENRLTRASDWLVSRPADVSATLDYMVSGWPQADVIDAERIGVFGFSMGGYTALAAAGALIDIELAAQYCRDVPEELTCAPSALDDVDPVELAPRLIAVVGDPRIAAISAAAPGYGYAFDQDALSNVSVPVQIWSGAEDVLVPHASNGAILAANLPTLPNVHVVEGADHAAFSIVCPDSIRQYDRHFWNLYCVDAEGFDRGEFHQQLHHELVEFFNSAMPP